MRLIGAYIQAKQEAIEEITNEKDAGFQCVTQDEKAEPKSERISRLRAYADMIIDKFSSQGNWFRRQERFLAVYIRVTDGIYREQWIRAWSVREAYQIFAKYIEKKVDMYERNQEHPMEFALFS